MSPTMKSTTLASLLLLVAAACQNSSSKLDTSTGAVPKEGGSSKGGFGGAGGGGAAAEVVDDLRRQIQSLESQLKNRIGDLETTLKGYDQYRTPLDIVAAKVKADSGQFTVPVAPQGVVGTGYAVRR